MELRPYQREAIDSIYSYFRSNTGNPLIVMPTGTGKSVVLAGFLREALNTWPGTRVIVLTHVRELIQQNFNAMLRAWDSAPAGIYSSGLGRRDINAQIIFAGIQSIYRRSYEVQRCDLVMIDEAHLLGKSDTGMYRTFLRALRSINPDLKVVGLTATPFRLDQGLLTDGEDALFTDVCYGLSLLRVIDEGYLVPLVPKQTKTVIDVSKVHTRGGEFIAGELESAVDLQEITNSAADELVAAGKDRGSWLVFCSGVKHAEHVRDAIRARGVTCEMVVGETIKADRDRFLREFKEGKIRCLTNMNVLTTGFDAPGLDLIGMLRPTKSQSLYVQMLGRGTRIAEGKDDCIVLDFAGNTKRLGTIDDIDERINKPGAAAMGEMPLKVCPECQTILPIAVMECPTCGYEFPKPELKIAAKSDTHILLTTQIRDEWLPVTRTSYHRHERDNKTPSMMVEYQTGMTYHREWVCFEHSGYPRSKAEQWWGVRSAHVQSDQHNEGVDPRGVPRGVNQALALVDRLKKPVAIAVRPNGKYTDIVGYKWV